MAYAALHQHVRIIAKAIHCSRPSQRRKATLCSAQWLTSYDSKAKQ